MARASNEVTQEEIATYETWIRENNIVNSDENAMTIANYVLDVWQVEFTKANLDAALVQLRPSLTFYTKLESEYLGLSRRMTPEQREILLSFIKTRGLKDDGDHQLQNFITIATWMLGKNHPINIESLDKALGNIMNGSRLPLLWKPRLQPSEAEHQKEEAAKQQQPPRQERTEMLGNEHVLAPHLREHQRQIHAALAEAEARKVAESNPKVDQSAWKARAESLVADSNLDNAAMKKLFVMQETNPSEIDWPSTHRARLNYIERRRNQRSLVGR